MSEYIKREDAVEEIAFELMYEAAIAMNLSYKELIELEASKQERIKLYVQKWLEQVPSADVVEVRHGKWKRVPYKTQGHEEVVTDGYSWCCTNCGDARRRNEPDMLFCPNCGAKMDGEKQEHEDDNN